MDQTYAISRGEMNEAKRLAAILNLPVHEIARAYELGMALKIRNLQRAAKIVETKGK